MNTHYSSMINSIKSKHSDSGNIADDIMRREWWHQIVSERFLPESSAEGDRFRLNSSDQRMKEYMKQLTELHRKIMEKDRLPCFETRSRDGWSAYEMNALGKKIRLCRDSCGTDLIMPPPAPTMDCASSA